MVLENLLQFQEELANKYKYKKLNSELSKEVRQLYKDNLPEINDVGSSKKLYSLDGTLIANDYNRIVIGDYGAFIEFKKEQVVKENIKVKKGQEYRINDPKYNNNVKYYWLTAKDNSNIKIYYQKRTVPYADYKPEMFYVSPYEVKISK